MVERERCPNCGSELTVNGPQGLCPACLLRQGLNTWDPGPPMHPEPSPTAAKIEETPPIPPVEGGGRSHAGGPPPIVGSADATESYHTAAAKADPDLTLSHSDVNDPASAPGSQGAVAMDGLPPRYEKLAEVGRGGMGKVLWCRDIELGRELAVKVLRPEHYNNADITRRFVAEARIVGQLQHPGITPVHEVGYTAGDWPYFTMKLVRGRTLRHCSATDPTRRPSGRGS